MKLLLSAAVAALISCGTAADESRIALALSDTASTDDLAALGRAIGDRRIVLLGENGHGVGEFSELKVRLVEWLHREKGFDVVAMESGFWECDQAERSSASTRAMLLGCLSYAFQHAELLPLFATVAENTGAESALQLAGIDIQAQGYDSELRPAWSEAVLAAFDPALADRVSRLDSLIYLPGDLGGLGEIVYPWLIENGTEVSALYDSAATLTAGFEHWAFRMSGALVDRMRLRADAGDGPRPSRYYELRDEWMARSVLALADSIAGERKVVVWLHNDHARYGGWSSGDMHVRSAGDYLREWYPNDVFSVGLFMARGTIADNSRNLSEVLPPAPGSIEEFLAGEGDARYLLLTGNNDPSVRTFADSSRPYHRMGTTEMRMVPAEEFDALLIVDSVGPPTYRVP